MRPLLFALGVFLALWLLLSRCRMTKKPAEVVQDIKRKVAAVRRARARPVAQAETDGAAMALPSSDDGAAVVCWCCHICGNATEAPVCPVDGHIPKGKA